MGSGERQSAMQITLEVPDEIAQNRQDLPRTLLESFALEGYRSGALTEEQVRKVLGYGTRMQVHGFLKEHGVYLNYDRGELEQDLQTLRQLPENEPTRR
jgi:predicted HTH domain antitoxin